MTFHDLVSHIIAEATGRSVDQHAVDPVPAAAHLPHTADRFRQIRNELLLAVDRMRTTLINGDDLHSPDDRAVRLAHKQIDELIHSYRSARGDVDKLIGDKDRARYAARQPARQVRRRYVKPGDTVLVVLPHTKACRKQQLAGRATRLTVGAHDAELDVTVGPGQLRLLHPDAGIYRDPSSARLYILQPAEPGGQADSSPEAP